MGPLPVGEHIEQREGAEREAREHHEERQGQGLVVGQRVCVCVRERERESVRVSE